LMNDSSLASSLGHGARFTKCTMCGRLNA
jgi:hypothetical protein